MTPQINKRSAQTRSNLRPASRRQIGGHFGALSALMMPRPGFLDRLGHVPLDHGVEHARDLERSDGALHLGGGHGDEGADESGHGVQRR